MLTPAVPIRLHSSRLTVDIAGPGSCYRGARFDWSSFVTQVELDNSHTFCGIEGPEGTNGMGLCCEFGPAMPTAFSEAAPGEHFVKLGVGLLTRPDAAPYSFLTPYAVDPFEFMTEIGADSVSFTAEPRPHHGHAMRLTRRLTVRENHLQMTVVLQNTGTKPVVTEEYCHNFITIDGKGPGPQLSLTTAFDFSHEEARQILRFQQNTAKWKRVPEDPFFLPGGSIQRAAGTYWVLRNEFTGAGMAESGSLPLERFSLWGDSHVVSPEVFVAINVAPGESQCWHRDYTFFKPGDIQPVIEQSRSCQPPVFPRCLSHSASRQTPQRASAK